MYPLPKTPIPSTSGFIPRPMSTFKPVAPANSQHTADAQNTYQQQSIGSSPGSSLPCGQRTPTASVSNTSTPPQVAVSPQPATPQFPNPNSFNTPQHGAHSPSMPSPIWQPKQQSPLQSPSTQSFIPAAVTHTTVSSTSEQKIPKSLNGERVKADQMHRMSNCVSIASNQVTLRRLVQNHPTAPSVEQKDTYLQNVLQRARTVDQWMKDENFEETKEAKTTKLAERNGNMHRTNHNFQAERTNV